MPDDTDLEGLPVEPDSTKITEHLLEIDQVAQLHGTLLDMDKLEKSKGLPQAAVDAYVLEHGLNSISPPPKANPFLQYLKFLFGLFNLMLLVAAILSFVLYAINPSESTSLWLGGVLIVVAMLNALLDSYQSHKTAALLASFAKMIPANADVCREGIRKSVPASEIVPGDLIFLKTGDKVPADMRLVICKDIKVDNSSLTGESEPQERSLSNSHENPMEASNIVFNGTSVVEGEGAGIVIRIGDDTVLGQIAGLTLKGKKRESQLTAEIEFFVKLLASIAVVTTIVFFLIGVARGYSASTNVTFAIGVFVSFVPEGLPTTVSTLLTLAARRMAAQNVLVKDLHGVETLGSITMLATDKTGTLTQNKMSVTGVWINTRFFDTLENDDEAFDGLNPRKLYTEAPGMELAINMCALCSKIRVDDAEWDKPVAERQVHGDATETGLYRFAMEHQDVCSLLDRCPKKFEIPFSSETKWHLTVNNHSHSTGFHTVFLKGAPERVLARCTHIIIEGEVFPLTEELRVQFNAAYEKFAGMGQRVLGLSFLPLSASSFPEDYEFSKQEDTYNFPTDGLIFLGLIALIDPPKRGVRRAIGILKTAGIQVVMVTGDHPLTAQAISRKIGLIQGESVEDAAKRLSLPVDSVPEDEYDAIVIHGDSIDKLALADWDHIFSKKEIVFARTSPKHKLEIVTRAQEKGHIVGVSGDGVNDSPALKKADLGISMNITGSDVSKDAAAMILLDDNFTTIVKGIEEGRLLFANLKKSIRYTLTHVMPQVLSFLVFIIFAIPLPITSLLILFIDLAAELAPAFSFAYEVPEKNLMMVPPRKVLVKGGKTYGRFMDETCFATIERTATIEFSRRATVDIPGSDYRPTSPVSLRLTRTLTNADFILDASRDLRVANDAPLPFTTTSFSSIQRPRSSQITSSKYSENCVSDSSIYKDPFFPTTHLSWQQKFKVFWAKLKGYFTRIFCPNKTGETLVDADLLFWCYFQGGIWLTIGAFGAYLFQMFEDGVPISMLYDSALTYFQEGAPGFMLTNGSWANDSAQLDILASVQSSYYAAIVIGQMFTLFIVKHRYDYPYGLDLFLNWRSLVALCVSAAIAAIVIYVPWFNTILGTGPVDILPLLMPLGSGVLYLLWEFGRRYLHFQGIETIDVFPVFCYFYFLGYLGGVPTTRENLLDIIRTTTQV